MVQISNNNATFIGNNDAPKEEKEEVLEEVKERELVYPVYSMPVARALIRKLYEDEKAGVKKYSLVDVSLNKKMSGQNPNEPPYVFWFGDCLELRNDMAKVVKQRKLARKKRRENEEPVQQED